MDPSMGDRPTIFGLPGCPAGRPFAYPVDTVLFGRPLNTPLPASENPNTDSAHIQVLF
jgi:hypothetical protein